LILIFLLQIFPGKSTAQDTSLKVSNLRDLGVIFMEKGEYQLAYYYNYSYYQMETDTAKRIGAALDAIDACLLTGHYPEADKIIFDLENWRSDVTDLLKMKYAYSLLKQKEFTRANIYLSRIENPLVFLNQYHFLKAWSGLNSNLKSECIDNLNLIDNTFIAYNEVNGIKEMLTSDKKQKTKHVALSLPMSMLVPGLGQAYSGFYFDALQSFGLNAAFGIGAYSSWRYELTKDKTDRTYVLPALSTLIFSVFYITNLYNTVNVTHKANLYSEQEYFRKISDRFDIILENDTYFVRFKIRL